jgi:thioredoxin-dependent peroxiredoxin
MDVKVRMGLVMKRMLACALLSLGFPLSVSAALDIGDHAPDFTTQAALAGSVFRFSLAESLKKGPWCSIFFLLPIPRAAR